MALNDIDEMIDILRRIRSEGDIMILEAVLRLLRNFVKHHQALLPPDSLVEIRKMINDIVELHHGGKTADVSWCSYELLEFIEYNTTLRYNYELKASNLSEYMDCLGENLNDVVLMCMKLHESADLNRLLKQLKVVQKKMRLWRYLYSREINGNVEHEKMECLETRIQFLADSVGQFCLAFWFKRDASKGPYLLCLVMLVQLEMQKIFQGELKASKFCQTKTFKYQKFPKDFSHHLRSLLMYLRNRKLEKFPKTVSTRNLDETIEFLLCFLADVPKCFIDDKLLNEVLKKVGDIVGDVLFFIQKLLPISGISDDTSKTNLYLIPIIEETENLKARVENYYKSMKFTLSCEFPAFGGLSFLDSLLRKLNEILKSEFTLGFMVKHHIANLEKELSYLTSIFKGVAKVHHEQIFFKDRQRRTINLAYEVDVSIDSILAEYKSLWHIYISLPTILKEIKHISKEVTEMSLENLPLQLCSMVEPSSTQHTVTSTDEEIVGFENDAEKIIQYLIECTKELDVIPIVGMGGQGKTTISRKVYNNSRIVSRFDVRAWCYISQTYNRRELLQEIFNQLSSYKVDEVDELADRLRKRLMGKRYLIVLDDMWDGMAWDDLGLSFPDGEIGSRIIVTTRLNYVGEHVKHHTDPYSLPFLTPEESVKLLQKRVFLKEGCPSKLHDVSLAVAKRCKGLPLAIILVAGIIKRKKMETSWWLEVKYSLRSHLGESEEYSPISTMQLSYDYLPNCLRPCFLYMGMFPEDERIPVSKLISLWIAEGFVQNVESRRMEKAAEGYLMDLISSNVVMVSKRAYNGQVKYCQVHDVVLHFCVEMSRKHKFMMVVKGPLMQFKPCDWKLSRLSFSFTYELSKIAFLVPKARNTYHQQLRSLIATSEGEYFLFKPFLFRQIIKLRLLRVLDLSSLLMVHFSLTTLNPLIHLKYLAFDTSSFYFHPETLLLNLETMMVTESDERWKKPLGNVPVPAIFWKMKKLRHVEIHGAVLRGVRFHIDDVDVLFDRCPNLHDLDIEVYGDSKHASLSFNKLESLTNLMLYSSTFLSDLNFPSNLKKLVFRCPDIVTKAPLIAGLPCLEYLKLVRYYRNPEVWCLGDITFRQLKFLKLKELDISMCNTLEASFPMLETLVIKRCHNLLEIPPSFADIPTLKQIELNWCGRTSLQASALKIKKEVEELGGCMHVYINGRKM